MRLYYRAQTGRPLRVAWALEEVGAEYEAIALSAEQCLEPEHLRRQPLGRVPVLELDDGQVLFDSTAIVFAIADRYPDAGLTGPLGSPLRSQVYGWSLTAMTELERSALGAWHRTAHVQPEFHERQLGVFVQGASVVAAQLGDKPFLLGEALTAADIIVGGVLAVAQHVGILGAAPAPVVGYFARLQARQGYARALARTESLLAR